MRDLCFGLSATLIVIIALAVIVRFHEGYVDVSACCRDHNHYLDMAGFSAEHSPPSTAPFAYRLLTPSIVRVLPGDPELGFHAVTTIALATALLSLFAIMSTLGFSRIGCASGVALSGSIYWVAEFPQMDFALVDPVTLALGGLTLLLMYRSAPNWLLAALLLLGTLNKESSLVLVAPIAVHWLRNNRLSSWSLLTFAPPVLALVILRIAVATDGSYSAWNAAGDAVSQRLGGDILGELGSYFIPTWGPMLLLLVFQPQSLFAFVRRFPELCALFVAAHAQLFVATDTSRLLAFAFFAVVPAVVFCLDRSVRSARQMLLLVVLICVLQGVYFEFTRQSVAAIAGARSSFSASREDWETYAIVITGAIAAVTALASFRARSLHVEASTATT